MEADAGFLSARPFEAENGSQCSLMCLLAIARVTAGLHSMQLGIEFGLPSRLSRDRVNSIGDSSFDNPGQIEGAAEGSLSHPEAESCSITRCPCRGLSVP